MYPQGEHDLWRKYGSRAKRLAEAPVQGAETGAGWYLSDITGEVVMQSDSIRSA